MIKFLIKFIIMSVVVITTTACTVYHQHGPYDLADGVGNQAGNGGRGGAGYHGGIGGAGGAGGNAY